MSSHRSLFFCLFCLSCILSADQCFSQISRRFSFTQPKMGSPFTVVFFCTDSQIAAAVSGHIFSYVDSLNMIFSDYEPNSELSRLSAAAGSGDWNHVSPELYNILNISRSAYVKSKYTFDITMGPLVDLWRNTRRTKKLPQKNILETRKKLTGFHLISTDTALHDVKLEVQGMRLDLGGIAKGYIAQAVINKLTSLGISSAMVNAGGDIACSDPPPGKDGWLIGVDYPEYYAGKFNGRLLLRNAAVATSGDMFQNIVLKGKRYSHIIDPKTGLGSTFNRTVTVIAPNGATADWMATACSLLKIGKAKKLIRHQKGTALLIVEKRKRGVKIFMSKHLEKYLF